MATAYSVLSQFCNKGTIVLKGGNWAEEQYGKVAANSTPGRVYVKTAADTFTIHNGSSHVGDQIWVLDHEKRTSTTFGEWDIDNVVSTTRNARFIRGSQPNVCVGAYFSTTQGASGAHFAGEPVMVSQISKGLFASGAYSAAHAVSFMIVAHFAEDVAASSTCHKIYLG